MEPVTHFMTGAVLARAGLNRRAAYATLAMTLAAEAPDLDTLWSLGGPVAGFQHHRGWTHTFLGIPFEALVLLGVILLWHRWRTRPRPHTNAPSSSGHIPTTPAPAAPVRWPLLYAFIVLALLSHIFLDWTNNYGVRPFFPFNPRWYAGSFVFIFEPVLFLILLLGLTAPTLFGLINSEIGAHREPFRGQGWAIAALLGVIALWGFRFYEHAGATSLALTGEFGDAPILRTSLSPYPINPFRWHAVVQTPDFSQVATVDTLSGTVATTEQEDRFYKPPVTLSTLAADRTPLGHAYLDWSQFPLVTESPGASASTLSDADLNPELTARDTTVTFTDLRFLYSTAFMDGRRHQPLSGSVLLTPDHRPVLTELNGKVDKP